MDSMMEDDGGVVDDGGGLNHGDGVHDWCGVHNRCGVHDGSGVDNGYGGFDYRDHGGGMDGHDGSGFDHGHRMGDHSTVVGNGAVGHDRGMDEAGGGGSVGEESSESQLE
jgi:hypothetical protein